MKTARDFALTYPTGAFCNCDAASERLCKRHTQLVILIETAMDAALASKPAGAEQGNLITEPRYVRAACPCLHTTPCAPNCTCVSPASSRGCRRCCSYGSIKQQREKAERLAGQIQELTEAHAALRLALPILNRHLHCLDVAIGAKEHKQFATAARDAVAQVLGNGGNEQ